MSRFPGAKDVSRQLPPAPGAAPLPSAPGTRCLLQPVPSALQPPQGYPSPAPSAGAGVKQRGRGELTGMRSSSLPSQNSQTRLSCPAPETAKPLAPRSLTPTPLFLPLNK